MKMKKPKTLKGMTLVEVLIAIAVLALVMAGALGIVQTGVFLSVSSTKSMTADITAQTLVEELVGRTRLEIAEYLNANEEDNIIVCSGELNSVKYRTTVTFGYEIGGNTYNGLAEVNVEILENGSTVHSLTALLNIYGGDI